MKEQRLLIKAPSVNAPRKFGKRMWKYERNKTETDTKTKQRTTKKNTAQINFDAENYTRKSHIPTLQDAKLQEISMYRNGRNVKLNLMHIGC
jgi:hypothetical protein